jgi:hypothetical protein
MHPGKHYRFYDRQQRKRRAACYNELRWGPDVVFVRGAEAARTRSTRSTFEAAVTQSLNRKIGHSVTSLSGCLTWRCLMERLPFQVVGAVVLR